jgi:signal transduction histidine kinase
MWHAEGQVCLDVDDQGPGFDQHAVARAGRLGLAFMQERVRLLGGTFVLETAPGCGTHNRARWPLTMEESKHD